MSPTILSTECGVQLNTGQTSSSAGRDLNVEPVWRRGFTGDGVVIAVVDQGTLAIPIRLTPTRYDHNNIIGNSYHL